jgi:glycosidase
MRSIPLAEATYGFHIANRLRKKYQLDETLFAAGGRIIFRNFRIVRELAYVMNKDRDPASHVYPGEVNAAGLINEICHLVLRQYEQTANPGVFGRLIQSAFVHYGTENTRKLLLDFTDNFPPSAVFSGETVPHEYLSGTTAGRPNTSIALEEMLLLNLDAINPGNKKIREFFDPVHLNDPVAFDHYIAQAEDFFHNEPPFGPASQDVITLLKAPMLASPNDLNGQLEYILENWKQILPEAVISKILVGQDLMKEDILLAGGPGGGTPTMAPQYKGRPEDAGDFRLGKSGYQYALDAYKDYEEYEAFTSDTDWMPRVVMLAKNTWVWLDQLSRKFEREIRTLDQIPDEELDELARRHINGLWLIGIWERSVASKRIKHIMGNIDAVSSAYSLYDYEIAHDLGGEEAYQHLNHRARERGIRLAGDMVPNHTGIYSRWVVERPHYFIQSEHPPFPAYRFTGEDLCPEPHIEIRLEDGYYNHSDAAVVFQRIDKNTGEVRYIYHGNDGTMMPWNDTAQLDFLKHEVREAVIQKIFEVARKFSIIRFDAAMTLAKKHFARLWYPRPGTGGDIASRSDHAMPQQQFDELFPSEFWREVVDRMSREMPDTLLLAEAFWFMEGYFVRTLGMHRVYNSAFMHMLKNEENEKYRDLITNTLEFEPEILKRYVNFMSNPDEETAINQFGTGDKYFGVCVLMNTLPGLPMFGHGQIEGYTEKYGMEYQRAYYDEMPQQWLVEKHEREIFPLLARRIIFSDVTHFNCFDYIDDHGQLNENVIAFTNMAGQEKALVLFNNKYDSTSGRIMESAPKLYKHEGVSKSITLSRALQLHPTEAHFYIVREHIAGLEYLCRGSDIDRQGFHWRLQGFEYRVFWQFREVYDTTGEFRELQQHLGGHGVPDMELALAGMRVSQVRETMEKLFGAEGHKQLIDLFDEQPATGDQAIPQKLGDDDTGLPMRKHKRLLAKDRSQAESRPGKQRDESPAHVDGLLTGDSADMLVSLLDKLQAYLDADRDLQEGLHGHDAIRKDALLARILSLPGAAEAYRFSQNRDTAQPDKILFSSLFDHSMVHDYLGIHMYEGITYFHKESFEELMGWLLLVHVKQLTDEHEAGSGEAAAPSHEKEIQQAMGYYRKLLIRAKEAGYRWPLRNSS